MQSEKEYQSIHNYEYECMNVYVFKVILPLSQREKAALYFRCILKSILHELTTSKHLQSILHYHVPVLKTYVCEHAYNQGMHTCLQKSSV